MDTRPLNTVRVGIGILILNNGKVLLGKRKGSHGEGEYAFPGGHMEYMESIVESAKREIMEECGITVKNVHFQCLINMKQYAPKHYLHIGLTAEYDSGTLEVKEPDKCESWDWYDINNPPQPLFYAVEQAISFYKTGQNFLDQ
jgi:8-oxo-dGTP diphosphatase